MKDLNNLRSGVMRKISPKRARKLWKRRGVFSWYSRELGFKVWLSEDMGNPKENS